MLGFGNGNDLHGRDKADYLVNQFGRSMRVSDAHLDSNNDRSFEEMGFHYDSAGNILTGRVFVAKAYLKNEDPKTVDGFRESLRAFNDPKLGGLFEGGGHFVLDEGKEMYFLTKAFPVESTTAKDLASQMQDLADIGARWVFSWIHHLSNIRKGKEPPPTHLVTRQNDPYPRR